MSLPRMDDLALKRMLKNWAGHHRVPAGAKARLIAAAAAPLKPPLKLTWADHQGHHRPADHYYMTFTWSLLGTLQAGQVGLHLCM